jgi:hypothetical protein
MMTHHANGAMKKDRCSSQTRHAWRMLRRLLCLLFAICVAVGVLLTASQQRAPGRPEGSISDPPLPPPDLTTLVQRTPFIIDGEVLSESHRTLATGSQALDFAVRIVEILKDDGRDRRTSDITVSVSRVTHLRRDGSAVRLASPPWSTNTRGIFFLSHWDDANAYSPMGGVFLEIKNESIAVPANLSHMSGFSGGGSIPRQNLIDLLKRGGR